MESRNLTFPGVLILGAGLMYLLDPERAKGKTAETSRGAGLQCVAGALGIAAVAYGASLFARHAGKDPSTHTYTALDIDMPNYAWLR
jgi:hypothetical protein